jgi:hypothetical protein
MPMRIPRRGKQGLCINLNRERLISFHLIATLLVAYHAFLIKGEPIKMSNQGFL